MPEEKVDADFREFLTAVVESADDDSPVKDTRHTSSVSSDDWRRVEEARRA